METDTIAALRHRFLELENVPKDLSDFLGLIIDALDEQRGQREQREK